MKHLNPRQGITTRIGVRDQDGAPGVKHLNPRQGITTRHRANGIPADSHFRVKHLNPRQGITTSSVAVIDAPDAPLRCETPKSPPGDYNLEWAKVMFARELEQV